MHNDRHSQRNHFVELLRNDHRYPNAAMARRLCRHRRMPVNRSSVHKIDRIIKLAQRALLPARELLADAITSRMRNGVARPTLGFELFSAAAGDWKNLRHHARVISDEQRLTDQVDLNVSFASFDRRRAVGGEQSFKIRARELSRGFEPLDFLKSDQRLARSLVPSAVYLARPIAEFSQTFFGGAMINSA